MMRACSITNGINKAKNETTTAIKIKMLIKDERLSPTFNLPMPIFFKKRFTGVNTNEITAARII